MKYVVAVYKNLLNESINEVPFGAVVTDGSTISFDFDNGRERAGLMSSVSESFDPLVFEHFKDSFIETFIKNGYAVTTDDSGDRHKIPVESEEFLDYLSKNSQSVFQYSPPRPVEAASTDFVLEILMRNIRLHS